MGNMSYCRFQNTLQDLQDCYDNLPNGDLSGNEAEAFADLVLLAKDIAHRFADVNSIQDLEEIARKQL